MGAVSHAACWVCWVRTARCALPQRAVIEILCCPFEAEPVRCAGLSFAHMVCRSEAGLLPSPCLCLPSAKHLGRAAGAARCGSLVASPVRHASLRPPCCLLPPGAIKWRPCFLLCILLSQAPARQGAAGYDGQAGCCG